MTIEKTGKWALWAWCKIFHCQPYFNGEYVQIIFSLFLWLCDYWFTIIDNSGLVSDTMLKFSYFYFLSLLSFHLSLLSISKVSKYVLNISINIFCFQKAYIWIWSLLPENQLWVSSVSYVYSSWHTIIWRLLFLF